MKKTINILSILLITGVLSGSCSHLLDEAPSGKISLEEVFEDNEKTMAYLGTCYLSMPEKGMRYDFWSRGPVCWCDDAADGDDVESSYANPAGNLYKGNANASSHPALWTGGRFPLAGNYWTNYWARIRNCAVFLANIDHAAVNSETDRSRWRAEAHLLRAYYYSELLLWFGCALPLIEEPYAYDADFSNVTRSSYYDVVKFIMKDCDAALAEDALPWRITTSGEAIRVTKALAQALKSRMILFAASPLYNEGQNHWDEAYQVTKTALAELEAHGYALYAKVNFPDVYKGANAHLPGGDGAALFNEYFCTSGAYSETPADKETIYQLADVQGLVFQCDLFGSINNYKIGTCPTQELVDAFETINGETILDLKKPYNDEKHLKPNYNSSNSMYDPKDPYANRDPRFYASIYYNGAKRYCTWASDAQATCFENIGKNGRTTRTIATWARYEDQSGKIVESAEPLTGLDFSDRKRTRTGYTQRKFAHPNSDAGQNQIGGARHKDFRLGEIILNFAEAAFEAGHPDEAVTAVNRIRNRVGMPNLPAGISGDDLRLRIRNERRVELALEGNRYFDIRRWSSPDGDLSATDHWVTAAYITHNNDGTYTYDRINTIERLCYENKFLKVPVPLSEVNNMLAISGENWQNPGW